MENRFEHTPEEEEKGWGAYATPPPTSGFGRSHNDANTGPGGQGSMLNYSSQPHKSLCSKVQEMLPSLLEQDGEIRPEMASSLYAHLSVCPPCKREYTEMQSVLSMLEALPSLDIPMDYSSAIMRQIQLGNLPNTDREKTLPIMASAPLAAENSVKNRSANVQTTSQRAQQQLTSVHSLTGTSLSTHYGVVRIGQQLLQRLIATAVGLALIAFFLSLNWGRQMLGANLEMAGEWLGQIGDTLKQVPVLGQIVASIVSALSQMSSSISEAYHSVGALAAQGIALNVGLGAAYYFWVRKNRAPRMRI